MPTNLEIIKQNEHRWFEAFNADNVNLLDELADELFDHDYTLHDPRTPNFGRGPAPVKQFVRQVLQALPDIHITLEDLFAEGDKLAERLTIRATRASTGKQGSFVVISISRYAGDKMAETWQLAGPEEGQT